MNPLQILNGRLLYLLVNVICYMFPGLFMCVVHVSLLMFHVLEKIIRTALEILGRLDIRGKAGKMLGKLKEKATDTALQRVADKSMNAGKSIYSLGSDVQSLEKALTALKAKASDIKEEVENAERSGKKRIKAEVKSWQNEVEQLEIEFNEFKTKLQEERSWKQRLFSGADVSRMEGRLSSLAKQSHNFGDLVLDVVENGQNNN